MPIINTFLNICLTVFPFGKTNGKINNHIVAHKQTAASRDCVTNLIGIINNENSICLTAAHFETGRGSTISILGIIFEGNLMNKLVVIVIVKNVYVDFFASIKQA